MKVNKKVMYILNTEKYSGAENVIIQIINNLKKTKYIGVYVSLNGPICKYLEREKIQFYPIEKLNVKNLKEAIKKIDPDIIHANDFRATAIAALCHRNIPLISHIHNNDPHLRRISLKSVVYLISSLFCKKILIVSSSVKEEYIFRNCMQNKTVNIGNPIDINYIKKFYKESTRLKYDIIFLGRLSIQKNPLYAIKIMEKVNKIFPIKCVIVGDGELRIQCERYLRENNLEEIINIVGFKMNPYVFLAESKILLMPSSWEGFGLSAVEALAFGKPVICSGAGGLKNIIDEKCGSICASTAQYIEEICKLLNDKYLYSTKSSNCCKRASELSNINDYMNKIIGIYEKING